jgi:hypothetical protein
MGPGKRVEPQVRAAWTVSIQGRWNLGALAVNQPGFCSRVRNRLPPQRVGFGRSFGVKLWGIWAVECGLPKLLAGSKRFKGLIKMSETSEIAKGDIRHIEVSGAHLSFHTAQVASGVWVFAA